MLAFHSYDPKTGRGGPAEDDLVGLLPLFWDERDPRTAREQLETAYAHGGGVSPFKGFKLIAWERPGHAALRYPGDPPMRELARASMRDETLIFFDGSWLAIVQPGGDHIITRVD